MSATQDGIVVKLVDSDGDTLEMIDVYFPIGMDADLVEPIRNAMVTAMSRRSPTGTLRIEAITA